VIGKRLWVMGGQRTEDRRQKTEGKRLEAMGDREEERQKVKVKSKKKIRLEAIGYG
jgi:uncharacterized protein YjbJ (UPF0337 family)